MPRREPDRETGHRHRTSRRHAVLRAVALLGVAVVWLGLAGVGGPLVGRLAEVAENDNASFLPESAESTRVAELAAGFSDDSALPYFVLAESTSGDALTDAQVAALTEWQSGVAMLEVPGAGGQVVGDFVLDASSGPPSEPVQVSDDGEAALVIVPLDAGRADRELDSGESVVFSVAEALRTSVTAALEPEGLDASVGGPGGVLADLVTAFSGIDGRLLQVTLVVVFVILLLVYRSPVLPFVALLSAVFALAAAGAVVYPLAKNGVIDLNGQSQGILLILTVGAATDYALLLIARYREELHDHRRSRDALLRAWRTSVPPILASGTTVVLGLLCLLLSDLGSTRGLGPVGALGIVAAMASVLTFLPVLLLAGRRLFWPRIPAVDHEHRSDVVAADGTVQGAGLWARVAGLVARRARPVWVVTLLVLLGLAAFAPTFEAEGTAQTEVFRDPVDSIAATEVLNAHFDGGAGSPTVVLADEADLEQVLDVVGGVEGIGDAVALPDLAGLSGPPADADGPPPPKVVDGRVEVLVTLSVPADTPEGEAVVTELRSSLDTVGDDVLVGGNTAANLDVREASLRDLQVIVPAVLVVILLVLIALLRSLVAPVLLVLANVVSFAATIGLSALVFGQVLDLPGSDPAIPLYGFVFLVALGIDYSIFLMTRVREESLGRGTRPGVLVGLAVTGGVITSAGVVLASTFGALGTIPLLFLLQVAFIVSVGVLIDTLVVRSLLVPALAYDLGPRVWWPSRLSRGEVPVDDARGEPARSATIVG